MLYNPDKLDEMILAILLINQVESGSAWKSLSWDSLDRLHDAGLISNPHSKAKSVSLTAQACEQAEKTICKCFLL